jgi:hypothetical protein
MKPKIEHGEKEKKKRLQVAAARTPCTVQTMACVMARGRKLGMPGRLNPPSFIGSIPRSISKEGQAGQRHVTPFFRGLFGGFRKKKKKKAGQNLGQK